jgi:(1->4)-alpha-D-glucan 1-alpha-D-glucosylmutase
LHALGITDCYASPLFKAGAQSTHGYDVCDFGQLNPNLGTVEDFDKFTTRLRDLGIGLMLDMVPNHMSTDTSNAWWFDVLAKGPASKYADWFDIDWQTLGAGKVVLPILEDDYEKVLQAGKLRLVFESQKPFIAYHDRRLPISPESAALISNQFEESGVEATLKQFNGTPGHANSFDRLQTLLQQQHYRLANWQTGLQEINYRRFFDINELVSLRVELPEVFDAAHKLVLSSLKSGEVSGLRIDHPDGLWDPKKYCCMLREKAPDAYLVVEKILTGDEQLPDDWPVEGTTGYDFVNHLNGLFVNQANQEAFDRLYREFTGVQDDFQTMVYDAKKRILLSSFPAGLNLLTTQLKRIAENAGNQQLTPDQLRGALVEVITAFPVYRTYATEEITQLSAAEKKFVEHAIRDARIRLSRESSGSSDVPEGHMKIAQRFNVGTTTGTVPSPKGTAEKDVPAEDKTFPLPLSNTEPLDLIHDLLLLHPPASLNKSAKVLCREFAMRFQQLTGPIMAKGLEDTAFYKFNRLVSLNEVGGDPDTFGNSVDDFHHHNSEKAARWPHSLLATATHDTKRGEDVRARINVLSEFPDEWQNAVTRWRDLNAAKKSVVNEKPAPDANDEYLLYQTLLGAWPGDDLSVAQLQFFRERMVACMLKSIKEAKTRTSWLNPNTAYEEATKNFVEGVLADSSQNDFLSDFKPFQQKLAFFGRLNSLSQTLLNMTAPGVPDFYQGTELWDLSLVDPDNRRPVDYEIRQRFLNELKTQVDRGPAFRAQLLADLLKDDQTGQSKLYLIWRVLEFRNRHRDLFDTGPYIPLTAAGTKKEHVCAFARIQGEEMAIVIAPRLFAGLANANRHLPFGPAVWEDTTLLLPGEFADGPYLDVLTNKTVSVSNGNSGNGLLIGQVIDQFPVALLEHHAETR